ncbi:aromatic acid exporter family protein [Streptomyces mirabilis]|uniref:aromatic acid exporter family protein n=1 Tax=Streptomyces mirabilis TaxID=68239 RepID=UPI00371D40AD
MAGWWWDAPMALMAPWTALFLVQSTVYRSLLSALQQLTVVVVGTLLAAVVGVLTHNTVAAMALALPLCTPSSTTGSGEPGTSRPPSCTGAPRRKRSTMPPRSSKNWASSATGRTRQPSPTPPPLRRSRTYGSNWPEPKTSPPPSAPAWSTPHAPDPDTRQDARIPSE